MARKKKSSSKTVTIDGKKYNKVSCHSSKSAADKAADALRAKGFTARRTSDNCVLKGPKRKKRR